MTNPWLSRRVINYAHQGGAREAPSSTLFAMRAAVAAGCEALELDVHMTADGVLVVCHDATVDRTTDGAGPISSMTFAEVQALDNAYWWVPGSVVAEGDERSLPTSAFPHRGKAPRDPAFRVPSLAEVLEEFRGVYLNLDVKQTAPAVPAYEAALAEELRTFDRIDDVIVASFDDASTDAFRRCAPEAATSYGATATAEFYRAVRNGEPPPVTPHVALQVPRTFGDTVVVDDSFVAAAHALGVAVHVWTVDDEAEMELLLDLGVDGIMTDRPTVLEAVLRSRGL